MSKKSWCPKFVQENSFLLEVPPLFLTRSLIYQIYFEVQMEIWKLYNPIDINVTYREWELRFFHCKMSKLCKNLVKSHRVYLFYRNSQNERHSFVFWEKVQFHKNSSKHFEINWPLQSLLQGSVQYSSLKRRAGGKTEIKNACLKSMNHG